MPTLQTSLAFFSVAALLALAPGPDNLFVLMQSATGGRRAGFAVVAGLMLGVMVHTLAVALGLAAVFAASAAAFTVLKLLGAAYLLYLAWGAWRAPPALVAEGEAAPAKTQSWPRLMARGVVMNLTNPKVVLFFLALLPQFVQPGRGPVALQMLWFGLLFIAAATLVFGAVVLAADALRGRLARSARAQRGLNRAAALVFVALAARLALAER
ncbi:LysE family translocator [Ottowia testudinis]|uniref:LysE family translocator n=1 Tax=Ottowia testudinis TaxID=2816950 RepID=A0A975CEB0_9BURK|nr:LysE family translocator [Ottowia testudinis]QTD44825.1 LysE family translocator [Ottowia testudinis]